LHLLQSGLSLPVTPQRTKRRLHPLARYLLIRGALTIVLVFAVTLVTFSLQKLVPGDPVQAVLGEQASGNPAIVNQTRKDMGLDKPLPVQYAIYIDHLLHGNLGISQQTHNSVGLELKRAFPATAELATAAMILSVLFGVGLGLWSALRRGKVTDQVITFVSLVGISAPVFWLGLLCFYVFFFKLRLLPGSGRLLPLAVAPPNVTGFYTIDAVLAGQWGTFADALRHLVMPATVLAVGTVGMLTRFARSSVLEILNMDYVRTAKAKGLPSRSVIFRYVLRGALVPIITVVGITFASLLSGAVLTETIFSWHGIGEYALKGATKLDLPAVMGVGLIVGIVFVLMNLIVDAIYGFVDPRVRRR
jgi:peptide/nickel transport system permease protein